MELANGTLHRRDRGTGRQPWACGTGLQPAHMKRMHESAQQADMPHPSPTFSIAPMHFIHVGSACGVPLLSKGCRPSGGHPALLSPQRLMMQAHNPLMIPGFPCTLYLEHRAQQEQVLLQTGLGCRELGLVHCLLPDPEALPQLVHAEDLELAQRRVQAQLALPLVKSCSVDNQGAGVGRATQAADRQLTLTFPKSIIGLSQSLQCMPQLKPALKSRQLL